MAAGDGTVDIRIRVRDAVRAEAELRRVGIQTGKLGTATATAGTRASGATRGFGLFRKSTDATRRSAALGATKVLALGAALYKFSQFAKDSIGVASDVNESLTKNRVLFGNYADDVNRFSKTSAVSFGVSRAAALAYTGVFGNLFNALGVADKRSANMSVSLTKLAADMASFNNTSIDDALEALRSGLVGETEPLRRFGVNLNDAQLRVEAMKLGLTDSTKNVLTPYQRSMAAVALITKQTGAAHGDFKRTSTGLANQQRILQARWEDMQAALGKKLLPAMLKVVGVVNDMMTAWDKGTGTMGDIKSVVQTLVGAFNSLSPALKQVVILSGVALAALAVNPWLALAIAIAGAALLIKKNWGTIVTFFRGVWMKVMGYFRVAFAFIKRLLNISGDDVRRFGAGLRNVFGFIIKVVQRYAKVWAWAWRSIIFPVIKRVAPGIKALIQGIGAVIGGLIKIVSGILTGRWRKVWQGAKQIVAGTLKGIAGLIRATTAPIRAAFAAVGKVVVSAAKGAFEGIKGAFRAAINWIIDRWNGLEFKIPGQSLPGPIPDIPGVTIGTPNLPRLALGGFAMSPGMALVGERGPEVLSIPTGAAVRPLTSREKVAPLDFGKLGGGEGDTRVIQLVVDRKVLAEATDRAVGDREARGKGRR